MSRTRIVKGRIRELVGGDYKLYSKSDIIYTASGQIIQTGIERGVSYGEPGEQPKAETRTRCAVQWTLLQNELSGSKKQAT